MSLSGAARTVGGLTGFFSLCLSFAACSPSSGAGNHGGGGNSDTGGQGTGEGPGGGNGNVGGNNVGGNNVGGGGNNNPGGSGNVGGSNVGGSGNAGGIAGGAGGTPTTVIPTDWVEPPGTNAVQAGALGVRLAGLQCAGQDHCCTHSHSATAACVSALQGTYVPLDYATTVDNFNAATAQSVLDEFENRAKNCDPTIAQWGATVTPANGKPAGLRTVVDGTNAAGATCTPSLGTNQADNLKNGAAALASCQNPAQDACLPIPNIIPDVPPTKWTCTAVGGNCFTDANCPEGSYCPNPTANAKVSKDWTCTPRLGAGQNCQGNPNWCQSLLCDKGTGLCVDVGDGNAVDEAYCLN